MVRLEFIGCCFSPKKCAFYLLFFVFVWVSPLQDERLHENAIVDNRLPNVLLHRYELYCVYFISFYYWFPFCTIPWQGVDRIWRQFPKKFPKFIEFLKFLITNTIQLYPKVKTIYNIYLVWYAFKFHIAFISLQFYRSLEYVSHRQNHMILHTLQKVNVLK